MNNFWLIFLTLFSLSIGIQADSKKVMFDQAHGQLFYIDRQDNLDLSLLADSFGNAGFQVVANKQPLTTESLSDIDALIISGAFQTPSHPEIKAIQAFLDSGGKLAVMLHVGPLVSRLLEQLGVAVSRAVIHDSLNATQGKSTDFPVRTLAGHQLFSGIDHFNLYGGWALKPLNSTSGVLALTNASAWLDMRRDQIRDNNPQGQFPVIVRGQFGQGEFIVFGDDAIFQNQFLVGNNLQMAKNLAAWMAD